MSSRKFVNSGNYQVILEDGRLVTRRPSSDQGTASIEISFSGGAPSGYLGVVDGQLRYGYDDSIPFDVYHQGRPPNISELDLLDQQFPGPQVPNVLYVAENGADSNTGERLSDPKRTLKSALQKANEIQARSLRMRLIEGQTHLEYLGDEFNGTFVPGSGYAANDVITLNDGTVVTVFNVSSGGVAGFEVTESGSDDVVPDCCVLTQSSTTGTGSGFALLPRDANVVSNGNRTPVKIFLKSGRYQENGPLVVGRRVGIWGDSLRTTFVSPRVKPFLVKANIARALLDPSGAAYQNTGDHSGDAALLSAAEFTILDDVDSYIGSNHASVPEQDRARYVQYAARLIQSLVRDLDTASVGADPTGTYQITNEISNLSTTYATERVAGALLDTPALAVNDPAALAGALRVVSAEASTAGVSGVPLTIVQELTESVATSVERVHDLSGDPTAAGQLAAAKSAIQIGLRGWLNNSSNVTPGLLSPTVQDKCVRDAVKVIDAVVDTLETGDISEVVRAAQAYYRSGSGVMTSEQRRVSVDALLYVATQAEAAVSTSQSLVRELVRIPAMTIQQPVDQSRPATISLTVTGEEAVSATVLDGGFGYRNNPGPNSALTSVVNRGGFENAAERMRLNTPIVRAVVSDYVNETYQGTTPLMTDEQFELCKRDIGYVWDALVSDLRAGGIRATVEAALSYFDGVASNLPAGQIAPTVDTFAQLARLANRIVRNQAIEPLYSGQPIGSLGASQVFPSGVPVTEFQAAQLTGQDPAPSFDAEDTRNYGKVGELIYGINQTISNPSVPSELMARLVMNQRNVDRPVTLSLSIENNAIIDAAVVDTGNLSGVSDGTYDVSDDIARPDDGYDLMHLNDGAYVAGMTFNNLRGNASAVSFDPYASDPLQSLDRKGEIVTSPYVQNCSAINPNEQGGVGMKINGRYVSGLRSMVSDAFTQINTAGTGVHLSNRGYAQLVSIFSVSSNIGILAESGGQCSVANSNSSFGNYGLVSRGVSDVLETATVTNWAIENSLTQTAFSNFYGGTGYVAGEVITLDSGTQLTVGAIDVSGAVTEFTVSAPGGPVLAGTTLRQTATSVPEGGSGFVLIVPVSSLTNTGQDYDAFSSRFLLQVDANARRPAFGDAVRFRTSYAGTLDAGVYSFSDLGVTARDEELLEIRNDGELVPSHLYRVLSRSPTVSIEFLPAFTGTPGVVTAEVRKYYTVESASDVTEAGGSHYTMVELDTGVSQTILNGSEVEFAQRSLITTSAHTFEYVGAGTNFLEATPAAGGEPIRANEITQDADAGGSVYFTSTDDKGDFKIGPELTINRSTGTITGEAFERSLFSVLTPYILSLEK